MHAPPTTRLTLRVSITDRCQFRCGYCLPPEGVARRAHTDMLRYEEIAALVGTLHGVAPLGKVRLTGGEPLVRPQVDRLVGLLANLAIPELALTTNGQLLAALAAPLRRAGLHRVNVSLDSLSAATYRQLTGGGALGRTLEGIDEALRCGLAPLKLNMVVMRGVNEAEAPALAAFALARGVEVRFLEVMPIGVARAQHAAWFVPSAETLAALQARYRLTPLPRERGSTSRTFQVEAGSGPAGRVGFISACSEPFCQDCNRLRLTSDGRLIGCLAADGGVPVRPLLAAGAAGRLQLEAVLRDLLAHKQVRRAFEQPQIMATIGG